MKEFEKRVRKMGVKLFVKIAIFWTIAYIALSKKGLFEEIKKGVELGSEKGIIFSLFIAAFLGTALWAFWILFTSVVYQPWNKSFRKLKEYGDVKEIVKAINIEYADLKLRKNEIRLSTDNWFIFDGYFTVMAIPKFMVINVSSIETKRGTTNYISLYIDLLNGKRKMMSLNKGNGVEAMGDIMSYIPYPDLEKEENMDQFAKYL